jgi:hypothetical protein
LKEDGNSVDGIGVNNKQMAALPGDRANGPANDPSHDFLRSSSSPLDSIFRPRTVAVIGATDREGSVGRSVLVNL